VVLVPDISEVKLDQHFGKDNVMIAHLMDTWPKDDRNLAALGQWIFKKFKPEGERALNGTFVSETYKQCIQQSFSEFEAYVFAELQDNPGKPSQFGGLRFGFNSESSNNYRGQWRTFIRKFKDYNLYIEDIFDIDESPESPGDRTIALKEAT